MRIFCLLFILIYFSGCSAFNGTGHEKILGRDTDLIKFAYKMADDLEMRAYPRLIPRHPDQPILTTTFVNNNDLEETSNFSRILQEHATSRLVQRGYTVREIKLQEELLIQPGIGESILSRDIRYINNSLKAQAILVGTYSITNRTMYISARLIDPNSANILSSADYRLTMDRTILAMFNLQVNEESSAQVIQEPKEPLLNKIFY